MTDWSTAAPTSGTGDILDVVEEPMPTVAAVPGLRVLHRSTNLRGRIRSFGGDQVVVEDAKGARHRLRNIPRACAVDGETVLLVAPAAAAAPAGPSLQATASGALVDPDAPARVARASRLWVEGDHDARLIERVWGDELRDLGIVVEPLGGVDDLAAAVRAFAPSEVRRLAVLVDHLVPGSKETRLAGPATEAGALVVGHPYVDVWQCVRASSVGIAAWPEIPRGRDWKQGVCDALGWGDPVDGWRRVLAAVDTGRDLDPVLLTAVEQALDHLFVGE